MLGVAMRIAQRIGIHDESMNTKQSPFEAEMRRRLWWSLIGFDSRMCEMADHKATILNPTWDCQLPLNVNDSDLRPAAKALPKVMKDLLRHCSRLCEQVCLTLFETALFISTSLIRH